MESFPDYYKALHYYDTIAHGWQTGGKGSKSKEGVGNSRILFQKTLDDGLDTHEKEQGYRPPLHWVGKMRQLVSL